MLLGFAIARIVIRYFRLVDVFPRPGNADPQALTASSPHIDFTFTNYWHEATLEPSAQTLSQKQQLGIHLH